MYDISAFLFSLVQAEFGDDLLNGIGWLFCLYLFLMYFFHWVGKERKFEKQDNYAKKRKDKFVEGLSSCVSVTHDYDWRVGVISLKVQNNKANKMKVQKIKPIKFMDCEYSFLDWCKFAVLHCATYCESYII
jgi:hypothetical protein